SWSSPRSSVDRLPATPARPHRGPVVEALAADPGRRVAAVAHDHDVREIDGGFLLHHTAGLLLVPRLLVTLHHVEALDDDAVLLADHAQHLAGLPLFPPAMTITVSFFLILLVRGRSTREAPARITAPPARAR